MLVATRQVDTLAVALFSIVLILGWHIDAERLKWRISPKLVGWMMLVFLPFPFIDWFVLGSSPIVSLIHFIFFASTMKLIQQKRNRDWLWLYVVSFFQMLLAAGMMIDTTFFILLLVFLFSAVSTLVSFEVRRAKFDLETTRQDQEAEETEYWRETASARNLLSPPRWHSLAYFSALSLFSILLLATPLFLAMPRLALRNSGAGWLQGNALSGFSDTVHLGDVGQLKLNPQLVMRVRVVQPPDQYRTPLRWRGVTLDFYDGSNWRDSSNLRRGNKIGARPVTKHGGTYWVDESVETNHAKVLPYVTQQTFYLEPLSTATIFAAPNPIWVEGLPSLWKDTSDGLWTSNHAVNRLVYQVESDTRQFSDKQLRKENSSEYDPEIKVRYTQLPINFDARIRDLATAVTKGAATQIDAIRRIENHLREQYKYSLDLRRTDETDPVADFLFNVRVGHCEYFATSMALMLRTQGIPARIVNGFQMGEYTDVSDFYTVRQSDAHSWVEAYFPRYGWLTFDPTPAAGLSAYENGWTATMRHYSEAVEMFWLEHVIGFGVSEQTTMAYRAQRLISDYQGDVSVRVTKWKMRIGDWLKSFSQEGSLRPINWTAQVREILLHPALLALYFIGLAIGGFVLWRKREMSWRRRFRQDAVGSAVAFYQEMLDILTRVGQTRAPDQTPLEFAHMVVQPNVTEITQLYQKVRFGGESLSEIEIKRIEILLKELRELKAQPKSHK